MRHFVFYDVMVQIRKTDHFFSSFSLRWSIKWLTLFSTWFLFRFSAKSLFFFYFQSSKCKKFIRLSPSSKKKHSKSRDKDLDACVPGASGVLKSENGMANANSDPRIPNGLNDKDVGKEGLQKLKHFCQISDSIAL